MPSTDAEILEIIGRLHEGVVDEDLWKEGIGNVCQLLNMQFLLLGSVSEAGKRVHFEFDYEATHRAVSLLEGPLADPAHNPWLALAAVHPLRRPATVDDLGGQQLLERTRIWEEFYVPLDLGDTLGATLERQPEFANFLVAGRRSAQPAFQRAEIDRLGAILPHLARAWRVKRALNEWEALAGTLKFVLDRLERAVIVTGPEGQIRFANRAADGLLSRGDGIDATRGHIRAARSYHGDALLALIGKAARTGVGEGTVAVDAISIPRTGASSSLAVVAEPLAPAHSDRLGHQAASGAVLFISDSDASNRPSADRLRVVYGLTPAEARLTSLVVDGGDVSSAARALGVSRNTVKYHLKTVFEKVGVSRQAQLVRRVLADVGGLAEPDKMRPSSVPGTP
jgi:DNA-binding CsgD family transcriptional regulator/PAS domain-containing protein